MEVLYVDNHVLAVNKPAGLLTHATEHSAECMQDLAKDWVRTTYQKPGKAFLEAIHRIDRPVSGVVVFARTSKALSRLTASVRNRECHKTYMAIVEGDLDDEGVMEDYLVHDDYKARIVPKESGEGKLARLKYQLLERSNGLSLIKIQLETGRYHQIRIQLASRGGPILGDRKYGSRLIYRPHAIALHHQEFSIPHPVKDEVLIFTAPLPVDWPW